MPGAVRGCNYNVTDMPTRHSAWVDAAALTLRSFRSEDRQGRVQARDAIAPAWAQRAPLKMDFT